MKKLMMAIIALVTMQVGLIAQPDPESKKEQRKEKIESLRVAHITKELALTPEEAQVFWPVYNEYQAKTEASRKEFRQKYNKQTDYNFATDKEAEDFITADIKHKAEEVELMKTYYEKLKKVISVKKVAKLRRAEESFRQELLKQVKRKMGE